MTDGGNINPIVNGEDNSIKPKNMPDLATKPMAMDLLLESFGTGN